MSNKIRVIVVDNSAVVRGFTKRILESDDTIEVVSSVGNGEHAVRAIMQQDIDVVVLDIEMPTMDGITALPLLIEAKPKVRVIMSSTLTTRNAEISLKALRLGAADYIPKPSTASELNSGEEFRKNLLEKERALGDVGSGRIAAAAPSRPTLSKSPVSGIARRRSPTQYPCAIQEISRPKFWPSAARPADHRPCSRSSRAFPPLGPCRS